MKRKKIKTNKMNYKTRPIRWGAYLNTSKLDSKLFSVKNVHASPQAHVFFCIAISRSFLHCNFVFLLFRAPFQDLCVPNLNLITHERFAKKMLSKNLTCQITHVTNTHKKCAQRTRVFTTWFCDGLKIQNSAQNWFRIMFWCKISSKLFVNFSRHFHNVDSCFEKTQSVDPMFELFYVKI